jgi:hypothetical protein
MMMSYMRGNIFSLKCGAHYPVHGVMLISILVSAMLDHNQGGLGQGINGTAV